MNLLLKQREELDSHKQAQIKKHLARIFINTKICAD